MKSNHIQHLLRECEQETVGNIPDVTTFEDWMNIKKPKQTNPNLKYYHFKK